MVLELMGKHESDVRVQQQGCWALKNFADIFNDRVAIAEAGGIEAIRGAMGKHESNVRVQVAGCGAMANLAPNNDNNSVSIAGAGSIEAIREAMGRHENDAEGASGGLLGAGQRGLPPMCPPPPPFIPGRKCRPDPGWHVCSQIHARAVISPIVVSTIIGCRHIHAALAATPRTPAAAAALPGHAIGTSAAVAATVIPGMGCRLDAAVITGCAGLTPRIRAIRLNRAHLL